MHDNSQVLMTGVTGFVGSSLAAALLSEGQSILAISRRDPRGEKTRAAVAQAARTLGLELSEGTLRTRLSTIPVALEEVGRALTEEVMRDVDTVWHLAATLSYNPARLSHSLDINLAATVDLYRVVAARAPQCRRFYQVSTAYCFGFPRAGELIPEALHPYPRDPNAYQLSKWCAETSLRAVALERRVPVTVVRPSIVVGNGRTGAYHGDPFGLYMFFSAAHPLLDLPGFAELRLPPEMDGFLNLVPIDALVDNLRQLPRCESTASPAFDVIHCTGQVIPARWVAQAGSRVAGIDVSFDGPLSAIDRLFAERVAENRIFAAHEFRFEERRLAQLLGPRLRLTALDEPALEKLVATYLQRLDRERGHVRVPKLLRPLLPWVAHTRGNLGPAVAKFLARGYGERAA